MADRVETSNAPYEVLLEGNKFMLSREDRRTLVKNFGIPKGRYEAFERWITSYGQHQYNAGIRDCEKALAKQYSLPEVGQEEVRVDFLDDIMPVIRQTKGIGKALADRIQAEFERRFGE